MKLTKIEGVELIAENEFSKSFKINDSIELYIAKAIDEEIDKHYIVASIPFIQEVQAERIQYPIVFDTPEERDEAFVKFDLNFAKTFIHDLTTFIREQREKNEKEQNEKEKNENIEDIESEKQ
jgi:hypothetical protein